MFDCLNPLAGLAAKNDGHFLIESRHQIVLHTSSLKKNFILAKRSVEWIEAKILPETPFEPTLQDLRQEAELL